MSFRIGQGLDVHAFAAGNHVMLGGVRIPHAHGIDALAIAREAGNGKAVNIVMVGTVLKDLPLKQEIISDVVKEITKGKGTEVNLKALAGGLAA